MDVADTLPALKLCQLSKGEIMLFYTFFNDEEFRIIEANSETQAKLDALPITFYFEKAQ